MRTLHRIATICFLSAAVAALVSACGSDATPTPTPTGSAGAAAGTAGGGAVTAGDPVNGATVYSSQSAECNACHGMKGEGALGPNITGNATAGIGAWSLSDFHNAVRTSVNRKGAALCAQMLPLTAAQISDQGIADVYAYLKTQDSATAVAGTYCSPPSYCFGAMCTGNAM